MLEQRDVEHLFQNYFHCSIISDVFSDVLTFISQNQLIINQDLIELHKDDIPDLVKHFVVR